MGTAPNLLNWAPLRIRFTPRTWPYQSKQSPRCRRCPLVMRSGLLPTPGVFGGRDTAPHIAPVWRRLLFVYGAGRPPGTAADCGGGAAPAPAPARPAGALPCLLFVWPAPATPVCLAQSAGSYLSAPRAISRRHQPGCRRGRPSALHRSSISGFSRLRKGSGKLPGRHY